MSFQGHRQSHTLSKWQYLRNSARCRCCYYRSV